MNTVCAATAGFLAPSLLGLGLLVLMLRRIISPLRFVQAFGGGAAGMLLVLALIQWAGGGHG